MNALVQDPNSIIRRATLLDVEFGLEFCRKSYPEFPVHLALPWAIDCARRPDRLVLVSGYGLGIASLGLKYGFLKQAKMEVLAVEPHRGMHVIAFLRNMIGWARENGAAEFVIGSTTGIDFGPLARRVGARSTDAPSYKISLR